MPTSVHPPNQLASTALTVHLQVVPPKSVMAYPHHRDEKWWRTIHPLSLTATTKVDPPGHPYCRPHPRSTPQSPPNQSPNLCWRVSHRSPAQLGFSTHVPLPMPPFFAVPPACTPSTCGRCNTVHANGYRPRLPIVCISCTSSDPMVAGLVG